MPHGEEITVAHSKVGNIFITCEEVVVQKAACITLGNRVVYFAVCFSLVDQCEELSSSSLHRLIEHGKSRKSLLASSSDLVVSDLLRLSHGSSDGSFAVRIDTSSR
jgi:hypothetical protein